MNNESEWTGNYVCDSACQQQKTHDVALFAAGGIVLLMTFMLIIVGTLIHRVTKARFMGEDK